ncbi:MAG: small multi-drug export protein [Clostridia bacterium]|nr:small multi-drug export protein [Clostridia bacterium]
MTDQIVNWIAGTFGEWLSPEIIVAVISMLPILELRGGFIAAALLGVNFWVALPICVLFNILPIPFILWLLEPIFKWFKKHSKVLGNLARKLEEKAQSKADKVQKYEFWGMVLFVGIPLPGTGAWTGALIASVLNMPRKKASLAILIGIVLATIIMCTVTYGIPALVSLIGA